MLTVLPIQSKDTQKELCEICKIDFNYNSFAYRADDGEFIGICQFHFDNFCGYIENLTYAPEIEDWEAMIIMLRATMSFMFRCGLKKAVLCKDSTSNDLLNRSGFLKSENDCYEIDLVKFYGGSCH